MLSYRLEGIVIGRTNFGEADRVVRLFTSEFGKFSAVAKGVRRIKSRAAGHLEPFGEVELMLARGRGSLDVITSARLKWYPHSLVTSYEQLEAAQQLSTLLDRLTQPSQPQPKAYQALRGMLHAMDSRGKTSALELWYRLYLLDGLGYRPELARCVTCGFAAISRNYFFNAPLGGIQCDACAEPGLTPMSPPAIKLCRLMCDHPYSSIATLADIESLASETLKPIGEFMDYHTGA